MTSDPNQLGETIFLARKSLKLSQEALGKLVGRTAVAVCRWESGRYGPTDDLVPLLAEVLRIPVGDLTKRRRHHTPRGPRTGAQILLKGTARYLSESKITLTPDQAEGLLKMITGHISELMEAVDSLQP